jgi:hypothetical protein
MVDSTKRTIKRIIRIALIIVGIYLLLRLSLYCIPFIIAFILSSLIEPMINFMEKKIKIPRKIGTVFSLLFVFSLLGTILGLIISRLVKEIVNVYNQINEIFGSLQYFFDAVIERVNNIYISLPKTISDTIDEIFSITHINEIGEKNKFEEIKANPYFPLIKYLLRNGYIDESYSDYITYFYGNSLNRIDKNFLLSVTDQIPKDYSYSLKNEKLVLSRLQITDFDHVAILNFDLLRYLLKTRPNNDEYLTSFLQQLVRTKNFDFIGRFLEERKEISLFVEAINNIWPSIFKSILAESGFSNAQIKQYAVYTLYYSPNNDIKALNEDGCLSSYISSSPDFLDINNPQIKKLIDGFSLIGVSFEWIDYNVSNKELFMAVYKNNLYKLTFNFICYSLDIEKQFPI